MTERPEIAAARAEVERSRARVMATAQELQERLEPQVLAKRAWQGAKEKGADLAEDAVDAVRARPLAATGVVAAIAMFLAREPLIDLAGKLVDGVGEEAQDRQEAPQGASNSRRRNGDSTMIDEDTTADTGARNGTRARQRAIEAYEAPATRRRGRPPTRLTKRR